MPESPSPPLKISIGSLSEVADLTVREGRCSGKAKPWKTRWKKLTIRQKSPRSGAEFVENFVSVLKENASDLSDRKIDQLDKFIIASWDSS
jgi:hypothetical protein